ncbi:MAG: VWA domain-containing protein [Pseudomonadota bacterium]|nr:VWA domain-containing protein [Pseudomonadota bacterium]
MSLQLLRPEWLWALLLLPLLWWWQRRKRQAKSPWHGVIDAHLQPHVLRPGKAQALTSAWLWPLAAALAILALAGPSWRQLEQPLWQHGRALVVAMDLSSSMQAQDLPPSRLLQARAKLAQLLEKRSGGQVALLVFADDAHMVSPLTDDHANIALFIEALAPHIMPQDGQRPARAIALAVKLLRQGGAQEGDILLLTSAADAAAISAAADAAAQGFKVSVIALGSESGSEIRMGDGRIFKTRMDSASLKQLAAAGQGAMLPLRHDAGDLQALGLLESTDLRKPDAGGRSGQVPQDEGYWLLLPLLLLSLLLLRRSALLAVALALMLATGLPAPVVAQEMPRRSWWLRPDQQQYRILREADAAYRAGDYARAAQAYAQVPGAQARYNLGNALAQSGQYQQAIAAYGEALAYRPQMEDARANRAAVERLLRQQQQQQQPSSSAGEQSPPQSAGGQSQQPGAQGNSQPQGQNQNQELQPQAAAQQAAAEARQAQRQAMNQALAAAGTSAKTAQHSPEKAADSGAAAQHEQQQALEAWLRRVPDTPGDWLRQKFWLEHQRRRAGGDGQ